MMNSKFPKIVGHSRFFQVGLQVVSFAIAICVWVYVVAPWIFSTAIDSANSKSFVFSIPILTIGIFVSGSCASWFMCLVRFVLKSARAKQSSPHTTDGVPSQESEMQRVRDSIQFVADQKRNLGYVLVRDDGSQKAHKKSIINLISIAKYCKSNCAARLRELCQCPINDTGLRDLVETALKYIGQCDDIEKSLAELRDASRIDRNQLKALGERCLQIAETIEKLKPTRNESAK